MISPTYDFVVRKPHKAAEELDAARTRITELQAVVDVLKEIKCRTPRQCTSSYEDGYDDGWDELAWQVIDAIKEVNRKLILTGNVFVDGDVLAAGYPYHKEKKSE